MISKRYKIKDLTWSRNAYSDGGTWTTEEWICDQYPDLILRVHKKKGYRREFAQFMLRGDHGTRHDGLKSAYQALMKRPVRRLGNVRKNQSR